MFQTDELATRRGPVKGMRGEFCRAWVQRSALQTHRRTCLLVLLATAWAVGVHADNPLPPIPPGSGLITLELEGEDLQPNESLGEQLKLAVSSQLDTIRYQDISVINISYYCPERGETDEPSQTIAPALAPTPNRRLLANPAPTDSNFLHSHKPSLSSAPFSSGVSRRFDRRQEQSLAALRVWSIPADPIIGVWGIPEETSADAQHVGPGDGAADVESTGADPWGIGADSVGVAGEGQGAWRRAGPDALRRRQLAAVGAPVGGAQAPAVLVRAGSGAAAVSPAPGPAVTGAPESEPDCHPVVQATLLLTPQTKDPNLESKVDLAIRSGEVSAQLRRQQVNISSITTLSWQTSAGSSKAHTNLQALDGNVPADQLYQAIPTGTAIFILLVIGADALESNVELNSVMFVTLTEQLNASVGGDNTDYVVQGTVSLVKTKQFPGGISPRDIGKLLADGGENLGRRRLLSTRGLIRPRFERLHLLRNRRAASSDDADEDTGDFGGGGGFMRGFISRGGDEGAPVLVRAGVIKQPKPLPPKGAAMAPKDQHGLWAARLAALGSSARGAALCLLPTGAKLANSRCRRRSLLQLEGAGSGGPLPVASPPVAVGALPALFMKFMVTGVPVTALAQLKRQLLFIVSTNQLLSAVQDAGQNISAIQYYGFQSGNVSIPTMSAAPALSPAELKAVEDTNTRWVVLAAVLPVIAVALLLGAALLYYWQRQKHQKAAAAQAEKVSASRGGKYSYRNGLSDVMEEDEGNESVQTSNGLQAHMSHRLSQGPESSRSEFHVMMDNMKERAMRTESGQVLLAGMHPGLHNDWEIDPSELQILKRPDGSEWELGSGAAGRVFKAVRNGVQVVAVKIFTDQLLSAACSAQYGEELRKEIFLLRSCHDRNVVQFLGAHLGEGNTILITEFMENGDLFRCLQHDTTGRFSWYRRLSASGKPIPGTGMARRVALDIARGLHFLHSKKIVHFDLKSANILLARDWTAKLADVGLSKVLKNEYLSTLRAVGTFCWSAPEILLGKPCTEKVDIYSYGVVLWELSVGEAPSGRSLRPLRVPEECPAEVEAFINKCLDPDPANRPSAKDLVDFLVELDPGVVPSKGALPMPLKTVPPKEGRPSKDALDSAGPSTVDGEALSPVETSKEVTTKENKDDGLSYFRPSMSPFSVG